MASISGTTSPEPAPLPSTMEHDVNDLFRQIGRLEAENVMLRERRRSHRDTIMNLVSFINSDAKVMPIGMHDASRSMHTMQEELSRTVEQYQQIEAGLQQSKKDLAAAQTLLEEYKATSAAATAKLKTELDQVKKDAVASIEAARSELQDYKKTAAAEITAAHAKLEDLMKTAAEASKTKVTSWLDHIDETKEVDLLGLHSDAVCHKLKPAVDKQGILFSTEDIEQSNEPSYPALFFRDNDGKQRQIPGTGDMPEIVPANAHWSRRGKNAFKVPFYLQQRLLNAAVFTETLEGEELDKHWNLFANDNKRYTKEQWQTYYHHVIRPLYLDKQTAVEAATTPVESPVTDMKDVSDSTTVQASAEASCHTVSLVDSADLSPQDTATTPSSVPILYGDKQIDLEYVDKSVDQLSSAVNSTIMPTPEASIAGPLLLGTDEQLAEARSFLQAATKGRGGKKSRRAAEMDSSCYFGMASSMHAPEPSVLHNDNFGGNTAVEVAGLPASLLAHDVIICLKPRGMISGRFVKTSGMKTIPPITTNTFIAVFPDNYITHAFCANKEAKESRLADLADEEVKLVLRQLPNDSQIINRRFQGLTDRGVTCSLLVEVTETEWAKMDLLDTVRKHSDTAISALSITDADDKQSVLIIFSDILMAWKAHNILKDYAELESRFVCPWADADEDSMPEEMDASAEATPEKVGESA